MKKLPLLLIIILTISYAVNAGAAEKNTTITIIERPGYFETQGNVFDIPPGKYRIVVKNMSGKDAGFVFNSGQNNINTDKSSIKVILLKNGEEGSFSVNLQKGNYTYFCPIIPTPPYPIRVK